MSNLNLSALVLLIASTTAGCMIGGDEGSTPDVPTYDEFVARFIGTTIDPETGAEHRFYDWDQPLESEEQVQKLYELYVAAKAEGESISEALVNTTLFGTRDVWSFGDRTNLTYCVSNLFGTNKSKVVSAMATATGQWSTATSGAVRFVYRSEYDASCTTSAPVKFNVVPINVDSGLIAQAFFPSFSRQNKQLLVNVRNAFAASPQFPFEGILRHELGHALGLRHETTRSEAVAEFGTKCFENTSFRALTAYDRNSVMMTPACVGSAIFSLNPTLSISDPDKIGIRRLYPSFSDTSGGSTGTSQCSVSLSVNGVTKSASCTSQNGVMTCQCKSGSDPATTCTTTSTSCSSTITSTSITVGCCRF